MRHLVCHLSLSLYGSTDVGRVCQEGLMLHPSPPAVPKAEACRIGIA